MSEFNGSDVLFCFEELCCDELINNLLEIIMYSR